MQVEFLFCNVFHVSPVTTGVLQSAVKGKTPSVTSLESNTRSLLQMKLKLTGFRR